MWRSLSILAAASVIIPVSTYALQPEANTTTPVAAETIAQRPPGEGQRGGEGARGDKNGPRWLDELNLSSEQRERIEAIHEQAKANNENLHEQLKEAREQMQSLMASNASTTELRQQHQTMESLHQQLSSQRFETMLAIREVLTPEQRAQLAELKEQRGGRGGRGR